MAGCINKLRAAAVTLSKMNSATHLIRRNLSVTHRLFEDSNVYIEIPVYAARPGETLEQKKARLIYQSRKRGIKETDLVLSTFAYKYLETLSEPELNEYDKLINIPSNDWDLYYWASGVEDPPEEFDGPVMRKLIEHTQNNERENRLQQPNLRVTE